MGRRDDDAPDGRQRGRVARMLGFSTQHPNDVAAWSRSLVKAFYDGRGGYLCAACRTRGAIPIDTEPDTRCAACGRLVTDAQQKKGAA